MTKIVINRVHGGFDLSDRALKWLIDNRDWKVTKYTDDGHLKDDEARIIDVSNDKQFQKNYILTTDAVYSEELRTDIDLIESIKKLGSEFVSDRFSELKIVEVPDNVDWYIDEYDGSEWVAERHRTWS